MTRLTPAIASQFSRLTLGHIGQPYPYKMDLVLNCPEDLRAPADFHPIFHGSFDWHSCVHGWWQIMRLMRLYPDLPEATVIRSRADEMLVPEKVQVELAFLDRPMSAGFERPYGWAWLLALHAELERHEGPWATALEPLALAFAQRFHAFLPKLTYPMRVGTHFNIAFALILANEWAKSRDKKLTALIETCVRQWFLEDRDCQAWEPGGDEFLSPALTEALLMSNILPPADFRIWFGAFLPRLAQGEPASLFTPALVSDRSDGKIVHLDGLNLSRAWCWRGIANALGTTHAISSIASSAALRHLETSLSHVAGDYMGEHWLASFALLALEPVEPAPT